MTTWTLNFVPDEPRPTALVRRLAKAHVVEAKARGR